MVLNCDIGERGAHHPVDCALIDHIGMANLACGGHAGDPATIAAFRHRAAERGIAVSAHLSYPDREHFGRRTLTIPWKALAASLEEQYRHLPDVPAVKFHGALYNDSCRDEVLAERLAQWLRATWCTTVITMPNSALAKACGAAGVAVLREAFAERRYVRDGETGLLSLMRREFPEASIHTLEEAVDHARNIILHRQVTVVEHPGDPESPTRTVAMEADTLCIHSDSPIALELAVHLRRMMAGWQREPPREAPR